MRIAMKTAGNGRDMAVLHRKVWNCGEVIPLIEGIGNLAGDGHYEIGEIHQCSIPDSQFSSDGNWKLGIEHWSDPLERIPSSLFLRGLRINGRWSFVRCRDGKPTPEDDRSDRSTRVRDIALHP